MYVLVIILFLFLFLRSRFWCKQPMRHLWGLPSTGVIRPDPWWNTYCSIHVHPSTLEEVEGYLDRKPLESAYCSVYKNPDIQGCILSRKVKFHYPTILDAYYHEIIKADSETIRQSLFQTHEYFRRRDTKCDISLFSSPTRIAWLVPVTRYPLEWIRSYWFKKYPIPKASFVQGTKENLSVLYDAWKKPFLCQMNPSLITLADMIDSKRISLFYYYQESLAAIFFFQNTMDLDKDDAILDWIGTIRFTKDPIEKAISTLLYSFRKVYPILRIHQVSDTPRYHGYKQSYLNHYIYNYGTKRISPKDCFFL